ncbi:UDP-glucose--hexose-1-phosphate uridylyltransferase [Edaphobacter sp.]|uniref:UDP-glucose--hexose-1-phosphate uridylyltransferase n=1 Tax=Edaphobacter sp. TaxID=1934404 RepID=UPI002DB83E3C|nr:UDP-glucose--hexose-1-phosphate uridylyltransferase [Edaphobacter sp.]HEU5341291.1 UDP-glucose--hexose-1-phosphate uridylyltransferase [Edaphobacter sp.]
MNPLAQKNPHRRFNPLKREWVLVSPNRTQRPWQGQVEKTVAPAALKYDPQCYLCPGNVRAGGARTDKYTSTYVFENDYAALKLDAPRFSSDEEGKGLLVADGESGVCRVICFSPRHDLTLAQMAVEDIRKVVDVWAEQYEELGARDDIAYVQVFENRGAMMGASNPHPHGQIWASRSVPNEVVTEVAGQRQYLKEHGCCLLCAYREMESRLGERVVASNEHFVAVVPFWAVWPFEVMILSTRHIAALEEMTDAEREGFAAILQGVTRTYDKVFDTPFPYSMGLHPRPYDGEDHAEWHFHVHFYPPLLRSATVRKFMVGFELLGGPQRDITAESAAETLRQAALR